MILDISDSTFKNVFNDEQLFLPIRWDGTDYSGFLENHFNYYIKILEMLPDEEKNYGTRSHANTEDIKMITGLIIQAVNHYLNGFPSRAFSTFNVAMNKLSRAPLRVYQKSVMEQFEKPNNNRQDELQLFRAVRVEDNKPYQRSRVFHTPFNLRSKVSTNRYSIAGYPSLYLGTSLELCCEEIHADPYKDYTIASLFKLERTIEYANINIRVVELGVKPQDFLDIHGDNERIRRFIPRSLTENDRVRSAFLLWYPLIAACSFIRVNKNDPFAAEYIVPQLLMQWVRSELVTNKDNEFDQLIGIRYFSCASIRASELGFNYVFPTSGIQKSAELPYCSVLTRAFRLTPPEYIHEYDDIYTCERKLTRSNDFDYIR